jgi:1-deoxy-D-xylulose-5-phosphate reductoisomerase
VIEAKWLFDLTPAEIEVIIHPQSIIHSFVHFADGSVKAQLGMPDMRVPILYAFTYPNRLRSDLPRMNFNQCGNFTFFQADPIRFRNLTLAYNALKTGGNMPCILNAANEVAVNAFLEGKIRFLQMSDVVEYAMSSGNITEKLSFELLAATDLEAREAATEYINKLL